MRIKLHGYRNRILILQLRSAVCHVMVHGYNWWWVDFDEFNFVDAKQSTDDCGYTHDHFDVMAAREDDS